MSKKKTIAHHYEPRIDSADLANYEILDWASADSQQARFAVLADRVELAGKSLLDIGCGLGDLWAYLQRRKISVQYIGVDILEKMVQAAMQKHPGVTFTHADIFTDSPFAGGSFDVAFCSGAFNLNLGNNMAFLASAINTMCRLARSHIVFNLLHKRARQEEHRYFFYDPAVVLKMLADSNLKEQIIDNYLPNDFT
ncbi:MAG: class I SAM-dependent methyltransferase, partial [Planctomycetaceae bacterium]